MSHIQVNNLSVQYNGNPALSNVTLAIPDVQITAVIGPSGCGKTTLLKSLNRLLDINDNVEVTGEVLVDGENIYGRGVDVLALRQRMGLLSQRPQPLPMSIYDNVAFGPRIHGLKNRRKLNEVVERYLRMSSLWGEVKDRLHSPASRLSVGQQQRLCLARGLAVEPEVILCDEPTSALDPVSAEGIEQRLKELKKDYTVVLVTHTLRQAKRLADYVAFMYLGELVEHGTANEVFDAPRQERTRNYVSGVIG